MSSMLIQAVLLIVQVLVAFLSYLLLARFFMQAARVPFNNSIGYFVLQLTNWLVIPLRKVIPAFRGFDLASLLPVFLLQLLQVILIFAVHGYLMQNNASSLLLPILWESGKAFLRTGFYFLILLLIAQAIISWVNPYSPVYPVCNALTAPILRPIQRIIPMVGRIDLSPLIAIVLIQVILIFLQ